MPVDDMHDDEIRARLGLPLLGRAMTMEERIEAAAVRAIPEPFDADADTALELADMTSAPSSSPPICSCSAARYDGDDGWDRQCPLHGAEAPE